MPRDSRDEVAPIERDEGADAAALEALHKEAADRIAAEAQRQEAAEKTAREEAAAALNNVPLPATNIMLHSYRQFEESEQATFRRVKDLYLIVWGALHELDGTPPEQTNFNSAELSYAALRLRESALWLEAAFHV